MSRQSLKGKVAVVAGATRGSGRGIAVELGAAGATVYCTGRSTREQASDMNRPETVEETAELVTEAGGTGIAVRVDHTVESDVKALFERLKKESGQLDLLVNDVWGGDPLTEWVPFWEHSLGNGLLMQERAVHSHLITSHYAAPLLLAQGSGLVLEITDGETLEYRGSLYYDLAKVSVIRLALAMAEDFKRNNQPITAVALTPGFLRSEAMLEHFGVTEDTWRDAVAKEPYFAESETPHYIGRAVAALAADPNVHQKAGQALSTWHLSEEYGFKDIDGRQPHWKRFFDEMKAKEGEA